MTKPTILLVDDDPSLRTVTKYHLQSAGYEVRLAVDGQEALELYKAEAPDLTITDVQMPKVNGMQLLAEVRRLDPQALVIVITAYGSIENAVEAMKQGAYDYLTKPFSRDALLPVVKRAMEYKALRHDNLHLRQELIDKYRFENIIGGSQKMQKLFADITRISQTDSTVLIEGESGTGKELVARAIHYHSPRKGSRFVAVNCPGIPESLLESELFGHVKGSFTGALANKPGKFELADGGTIFLDEIADMEPGLQAKLLRVLQEREVDKVGGTSPVKVDVRVIAATNKNLREQVDKGKFRPDLYYRIGVVPLKLPPLRERIEDIPLLVEHFLQKYKSPECKVEQPVYRMFQAYPWPGNVRELENVIEQALVLGAQRNLITAADLPEHIRQAETESPQICLDIPPQGLVLEDLEKELVAQALRKTGGNQTKAATLLGISRQSLIYRMEKFGLKPYTDSPSDIKLSGGNT